MKKLLLLFVLTLLPMLACADYYDVKIDGIFYKLNKDSKEATVAMGCNDDNGLYEQNRVVSYAGDVVIPESFTYNGIAYTVTSIEGQVRGLDVFTSYGAFEGCKDLTSITIPKTIKSIGHQAFAGCTSLQSVYISDLAAWCDICFDLYDRYGNYFSNANPLFFAHDLYLNGNKISNLTIPDEVTTIKEGTFIGCSITSVVFHKNVSDIGCAAFDGCNNLTDVYSYSPSLTTHSNIHAGRGAFIDHTNKKLHIRERYYDSYFTDDPYDGLSKEWKQFGKVEYIEGIDYNLVYVVDDAEYKKNIMEVGEAITPESAPSKQGYTFSGWSEIPEKMPANDVTITGSFSPNTYKLTYNVDGEEYKVVEVKCDETITAEAYPTKKGMTFSGWSEIPEKMPAKNVSVTGTFSWSKVAKDGVIYQVYNAEDELAGVCGNDNASGEVKIVSPIEIDGCKYSVTDIADNVFKNNTEITSVVIPESVRKIGDEAFYGCKNLAKIELGKSVNQIEPRVFAGIDKLTDVTIYAENVPSTDRTAFENSYIEDYVTLYVPAGSVEKYKAAAPWKNFKEIVAMSDAGADDTDVDVITIKSYGKGTYCSDYDLDFSYTENLKAFIVTGYDHKTNTIWLTRVKSVPAGTGIIVKGTPGDYKVKHVESLSVYANFLVGTTEDKKIKDVEGEMTNFVLSKGEWYRFDGEITLPKGMAYLPLPLSKFAGTRTLIEVYEDNDKGTTGIWAIEQGTVSSEHDVWFNLQGQRVTNPGKGLYIRNGKKVVIK